MESTAFYQAAVAVALGMAGQLVAARAAIPSIVVLLLLGVAFGPDVLGVLRPEAFGAARTDLVTLAVTVILFEGGLALRLDALRQQQRILLLLLTLGGAISMLVGTCAAHYLLGLAWPIASLYGALMIVTGPTVVTPLLTRLAIDRPVRELLISEGVLIDPVGAIVAIVTAEYVLGHFAMWEAGTAIVGRLMTGVAIGALAGAVCALVLRRQWISEELRNPAILAVVLLTAALASRLSREAGLMTAVIQGVVIASVGLRDLGPLRQFKEELTMFLLSFVFVLLAAGLPLSTLRALGWPALLVVGVLIWVGRPLAVFLCTLQSELTTRQRLFVAWICPRGIVAVGVAGLFGIWLEEAELPGGQHLEALVFVTVAATVAVQGLTAGTVARWLGVDLPELRGTIIVGADFIGRLLAKLLQARGREAILLDLNPLHCRLAQEEGLRVHRGDALSIDSFEEAGIRSADVVLALTRNYELNALVAQKVRHSFRVERVLALGEAARERPAPLPGNFPGVDDANRALRDGRLCLAEYEVKGAPWAGRQVTELPYGSGEFALLLQRRDRTYVAQSQQTLEAGDCLYCLQPCDEVSPLVSALHLKGISQLHEGRSRRQERVGRDFA